MSSLIFRKSLLCIVLAATGALPSQALFAREGGSGGVGNGGGSWTCRTTTPAHSLIWVDLVDLSEGRREFGLNIPSIDPVAGNAMSVEQFQAAAEAKIKQANPAFFALYQKFSAGVKERFHLPTDSEFDRVPDVLHRTRPAASTCPDGVISDEPEQLANFTTLGQLLVNPELWQSPQLSNMGRAALLVHEAIYWMLRQPVMGGDTDSVRTREIVGYLFSDAAVAKYAFLFPSPSAEPAPLPIPLQPRAGIYGEIMARMADIEITYFDSQTSQLMLTERDRDNHLHAMSNSVFQCAPLGSELDCRMISSNSRAKRHRGFDKYRIRISAPDSFAWFTQLDDGAPRVTRYRLYR